MSKQRSVDTCFWDDRYITQLDPSEKLLFLYLLTNTLTNICGVYQREYGRPCPLVPSKEDMALIAAAPQLLEALKQIDAESQGGFRRPVEEMIAIARAAIAAAEGKI